MVVGEKYGRSQLKVNTCIQTVEVTKSLGGAGFDNMAEQNIQELPSKEEINEAGMA